MSFKLKPILTFEHLRDAQETSNTCSSRETGRHGIVPAGAMERNISAASVFPFL